ncbi:MAG: hypothetical protein EA392_02640 [Cryomorphaceae bacterium]|nr:MAG: hypothetical protein EA392_02640 [Cryomorphaceae bacterium]
MVKPFFLAILLTLGCAAGPGEGYASAKNHNNGILQPPCPEAERGLETMIALIDKWKKIPEAEGLQELLAMELKELKKNCPDSEERNAGLHRFIAPLDGMLKEMGNPASMESMSKVQLHLLGYYEEFY